MPTYQYLCEHCGHSLEISQKITAEPLKTCPQCNLDFLKRGIGGGCSTLRFLGSGFYITDYGSKGEPPCSKCDCKESTSSSVKDPG